MSRLVTYAMLVKQGFTSASNCLAVNTTAVFGSDRQGYYDNLEAADSLSNAGIVAWCTYVLAGLNTDLKKLSRLSGAHFVTKQILVPAIERLRAAGGLTVGEARALTIAANTRTPFSARLPPTVGPAVGERDRLCEAVITREC